MYKNDRNVRFVLFTKTSNVANRLHSALLTTSEMYKNVIVGIKLEYSGTEVADPSGRGSLPPTPITDQSFLNSIGFSKKIILVGNVNSKSFVSKVLLRIKWKFELTVHFKHEM